MTRRAEVGVADGAEELESANRRSRQSRRIPLPNVIKAAREAGASRVKTPDGYVIDLLPRPVAHGDVNDFDRPPNVTPLPRRARR